jgi:phosphonate transport system ATP-binding protein
MLLLENLTKRFGARTAVNCVRLEIPDGQFVGVIGRSGAGKSTLLRLLNRLIEPSSGRVVADGVDVTALRGRSLRDWRARAAMIFQQFNLVPRLDVITNVLIGRLSRHATVPSLLRHFSAPERALAVHALQRLDLLSHALQRADTLSGGQQQRVAIARALVQGPSLLLADEPIASLDPRNAARVMEALRAINQEDGITVICNLHDPEIARRYCDRIVAMADGSIVFDGRPVALSRTQIEAIYGADADRTDAAAVEALLAAS